MNKTVKYYFLKLLRNNASKWLVLLIDMFLVCIAFFFSYSIRYNISFEFNLANAIQQLPVVMVVALISFLTVGSYKGIIRHTGIRDAVNVFFGLTFMVASFLLIDLGLKVFHINTSFQIPRSIISIHYLLSVFTLVLSRFAFRVFFDIISTEIKNVSNVLIFGAGEAGIITYNALNRDKKSNNEIVGFIDDDPKKIGKKINRIKIFGFDAITNDFIHKNDIQTVIVSTLRIGSVRLLEITGKFERMGVSIKKVPAFSQWMEGSFQANQIKQLNIEDLLNRDAIQIDNPAVKAKVSNKVILITGAAGSIGSEIVRQLSTYKVKDLILVDQAESALYDLEQELIQSGFSNFHAIVTDVRDKLKLEEVFKTFKPQRVFHAAAYKHVPLMEKFPYEAIRVNVLGTKNLTDLAQQYKIERFVMVSTDKAVNPTNVMGASKRMAELYINTLSYFSKHTKFTITRFGNVLGSNGSVIPLFKRQLEQGGPLTVTHKEITRFFMTIPEACALVLEAGTMGKGGEIYVFDMGQSVKIFDIAKRMIYLSGLRYPEDIEIQITGLRPGEKLYEELLTTGETTMPTYHEKIMIAKTSQIEFDVIKRKIDGFTRNFHKMTSMELVQMMKAIVPEYVSNNSIYEQLDVEQTKEK